MGNRFSAPNKEARLDVSNDASIVFLDIDGVLNSRVSRENGDHLPDPAMLSNLKLAMQQVPNCLIVLSSTWRLDSTLARPLRDVLSSEGLSITDFTPDLEKLHIGDRVDEIILWLREHKSEGLPWVAVDDMDLLAMNSKLTAEHFVRTYDGTGLTPGNADELRLKLQAQRTLRDSVCTSPESAARQTGAVTRSRQ